MSDDICNALSLEFSNNVADKSHIMVSPHSTEQYNFHVDLFMSSLLSVIQGLTCSAAGPDGIPAMVCKCCSNNLARRPLLYIFQQSMFEGRLPKAWKTAIIIPLFKGKGDRSLASSYCPISLTNIACKMLERLFVKSLNEYISTNSLLDTRQHGFSKGRSTVSNLQECEKHQKELINNNVACDIVMIDFKRAFDKVDHAILCEKLQDIGVDGCYLK